eukprot:TRINITY_DN17445_c0_g1_i1.p1 TRINITY_DN17445_c0_g1~~TRINITY_DN17445_c0_g1_i1.p1  ORF type:complete len:149 (-),score=9.09 TRINITY_DN17445_c0_g1_i1:82-528(-)
MSFTNYDWGSHGGKCWEFYRLTPCCGLPCNVIDGLYCCACWAVCGLCSFSKLFASSVQQECKVINHCVSACVCFPCVAVWTRHNLRRQIGIGGNDCMNWCGDILCILFCGPCSICQMCRAFETKSWDCFRAIKEHRTGMYGEPWKFIY